MEKVPSGYVFFTLPWQSHGSVRDFEPGHYWRYCILRVETEDLERNRPFRFPCALGLTDKENRRITDVLRFCTRHAWPAGNRLSWAMRELVASAATSAGDENLVQRSLVGLVLAELLMTIERNPDPPVISNRWRVRRVAEAITGSLEEPWTLDEMTVMAGLGKSHFIEQFRQETGDTPRKFLNRKRVEAARRLLWQSNESITGIAHACGFGSSQRFATVFRRFTGVTPSRYRQARQHA